MPLSFARLDVELSSLPGATVGVRWGNKHWLIGGHAFAWHRPLSQADIKRYGDAERPHGEILAVQVESLDAKDALLAMSLPGFFTIPHFNGYPAVLIELRKARAADVRAAIADAFRVASAKPPRSPPKSRSRRTPAGGRATRARSSRRRTAG